VESKPAARTHTIKPGDTLSSLAARYLGSSARYQEIFEANRKLLKSPNELPEGLVIVIPEAHRAVTPSPETQRRREPDRSPEAPATSSASGLAEVDAFDSGSPTLPSRRAGKLRFEPVRRSGFSAGRVRGAGEAPSERARSQPAGVDLEVEEDDAAATP
jgi:phage tail protein X